MNGVVKINKCSVNKVMRTVHDTKNAYSVCLFTANYTKQAEAFPDNIQKYGTTALFKVSSYHLPAKLLGKISFNLEGHWEKDTHGTKGDEKIFVAEKASESMPETRAEIIKFLMNSSKGVGKVTAETIYNKFGDETLDIHTVKSFLHLVVKDMTQEEEQLIDTSLYKVYGRFGITNDNDSIFDLENGGYKKMPLLEDLQKEMQNVPELHRICNILNPLIRGSMACYNRPTNVDLKAKYIVFDFNGMKGPTLTMSMFVVLDFVWTKIKEDRAKRKAVFIDECWKLIGTDSNEMAAEDVVEIFRTIRAYGGSAFAMTQDISQFYEYKGGKYGKAVIGNADTKIIMHLIPSEAKALQAAIQLTDSEMENVSNLGRGQGLVCSGAAKLFVDFIAAPYEKQEITTDAKSFYLQEKALKEKQHKEEQERLAAEKANSNTDANDDDADLLNVTF